DDERVAPEPDRIADLERHLVDALAVVEDAVLALQVAQDHAAFFVESECRMLARDEHVENGEVAALAADDGDGIVDGDVDGTGGARSGSGDLESDFHGELYSIPIRTRLAARPAHPTASVE